VIIALAYNSTELQGFKEYVPSYVFTDDSLGVWKKSSKGEKAKKQHQKRFICQQIFSVLLKK
jgi:hypothetical protein